MVAAGVPIFLPNRVAWAQVHAGESRSFLAVRDGQGRAETGVAVFFQEGRAIPGLPKGAETPEPDEAELVGTGQVDVGLGKGGTAESQDPATHG